MEGLNLFGEGGGNFWGLICICRCGSLSVFVFWVVGEKWWWGGLVLRLVSL